MGGQVLACSLCWGVHVHVDGTITAQPTLPSSPTPPPPQLLLQRLAAATPVLACSCFDTLMSVQHQQPPAFSEFVRQRGVEQVCEVLRHGGDRVRAHAARFLNLLLTHLAPALRGEGVEEDVAASGRSVQSVLGREASAMLHRKVDLADAQAEGKLSQLANALQFFMG